MNKIKINTFLLYAALLSSIVAAAQTVDNETVNIGDLTITQGIDVSSIGPFINTSTADFVNDGNLYLYGHYKNEGLVTFTPGTTSGRTLFSGTSGFQEISGASPFEWNNVEFNNAQIQPAFHLSVEAHIFGEALFQKGIIEALTYDGSVVFEDNATQKGASDTSYINGIVYKIGNDIFDFPVGADGHYRPVGMSAPANVTDSFIGKYFLDNPDPLYPINNKETTINLVNDAEFWEIDQTDRTSDILVTLSWNENTTPSAIYALPINEIHIVRWDPDKKIWTDQGGVTNADTKEVTMVINKSDNYGVFTLARVSSAGLPSDLIIYNAVSPNGDGKNEYFKIAGIKKYPNNRVEIYNRWGVRVFETTAYDTNGNVFRGVSNGRATVTSDGKLPDGTYFYIVDVKNDTGEKILKEAGYLQLSDN
jgi:gliding motility-associated-like protein